MENTFKYALAASALALLTACCGDCGNDTVGNAST